MAIKKVITVCPYCASGCKIHLLVENNKIVGAEGANGKTNEGELCLKGYYGWDFVHDTKILTPRLTQPMIRYTRGPGNEVNFVMQKFARAVLGNNNIDCCARV